VSARKGLFEEADGGTFFFDEIGETSLAFQAKLLRAIQENEVRRVGENKAIQVDVRIIAATNQDLLGRDRREALPTRPLLPPQRRRFQLPPLRERMEDLPELLGHFIAKLNKKMGVRARFDDRVIESLQQYAFPGNVRELEHMVEQAVALVQDGVIHPEDLLPHANAPQAPPRPKGAGRTLAETVDAAERGAIEEALRDADGNRERAAELLGISPTTLWRKMTRLNVSFETRA
jgi:two-component system response regulator HydG